MTPLRNVLNWNGPKVIHTQNVPIRNGLAWNGPNHNDLNLWAACRNSLNETASTIKMLTEMAPTAISSCVRLSAP